MTRTGSAGSPVTLRTTAFVNADDIQENAPAPEEKAAATKPKTRAGKPLNNKVPMTISFSERMNFAGRSVDPEGRPAARIDFYGIVTAEMEDALLYAEEKMIAFTDREVPLAQLGEMSKAKKKRGAAGAAQEAEEQEGEAKSSAELALIFCYRNAVSHQPQGRSRFPQTDPAAEARGGRHPGLRPPHRRLSRPGQGNGLPLRPERQVVANFRFKFGRGEQGGQPSRGHRDAADCQPDIEPDDQAGHRQSRHRARPGTRGTTKNAQSRQADQPAAAEGPSYGLDSGPFQEGDARPVRKSARKPTRSRPAGRNSSGTSRPARAKVPEHSRPSSTPIGCRSTACF